jgi:hypothetical protein
MSVVDACLLIARKEERGGHCGRWTHEYRRFCGPATDIPLEDFATRDID